MSHRCSCCDRSAGSNAALLLLLLPLLKALAWLALALLLASRPRCA
jgi:hypothetical protein